MKTATKIASVAASVALLAAAAGCSGSGPDATDSTGGKVYQIGISQIMTHPSLDAIRNGFMGCMSDAGYKDGDNVKYDYQNPENDQSALTSIASTFASEKKDLVVAITTPVAQAFAQAMPDQKIIFAGVTDPVSAGLVNSFEKPGGNLTGSSDYPPIDQQLELITKIKPGAKTIGIVYASSEANAETQVQLAKDAAAKLGLTVRTAAVTSASEIQQAATSLDGVDAYYVGNDNTVVGSIEALISVAEQQQVPVIASDPDSVSRGAVGAYAVSQQQMGCEAAKLAVKVLQGQDPADIPVTKMADLGGTALALTLNKSAAAKQGVTLSDDLLSGATVVG
jgi:putative ABC transport system substrate-binding protein